jgi:hypothetical protein
MGSHPSVGMAGIAALRWDATGTARSGHAGTDGTTWPGFARVDGIGQASLDTRGEAATSKDWHRMAGKWRGRNGMPRHGPDGNGLAGPDWHREARPGEAG